MKASKNCASRQNTSGSLTLCCITSESVRPNEWLDFFFFEWMVIKQTKYLKPADWHYRITAKHQLNCKYIISCIQIFSDFIIDTKESEKMHSKHVFHGDFLIKTLIHISLKPVFAEVK